MSTARFGESLYRITQEWQRFVTLVKQSQELKTVSYHKLYDILKQHQNEVNEIRAERLARTTNPLALVAQQQPVYHPQNHPNQTLNIPPPDHNNLPEIEEKQLLPLLLLLMIQNLLRYAEVWIQCYKCKEFWAVYGNIRKPKRDKDASLSQGKYVIELEQYYIVLWPDSEVTPDPDDNSGQSLMMSQCISLVDDQDENLMILDHECDLLASLFQKLIRFQAELDKYNDVNYASSGLDCAKANRVYVNKINFEKSSNAILETNKRFKSNDFGYENGAL
ncbi:hypothetical protein Tco_0743052 [Tanacetum coccineum]